MTSEGCVKLQSNPAQLVRVQSRLCSRASLSLISHPNSSTCLLARHPDDDFLSDSSCTAVNAESLFSILILISKSSIIFRLRKLSTLSGDVHDMNVGMCPTQRVLPAHFTRLPFSSQRREGTICPDWKTNQL